MDQLKSFLNLREIKNKRTYAKHTVKKIISILLICGRYKKEIRENL